MLVKCCVNMWTYQAFLHSRQWAVLQVTNSQSVETSHRHSRTFSPSHVGPKIVLLSRGCCATDALPDRNGIASTVAKSRCAGNSTYSAMFTTRNENKGLYNAQDQVQPDKEMQCQWHGTWMLLKPPYRPSLIQ